MSFYTVPWGIDPSGDNVAMSYSRYIITELLRKRFGYDGVVCTGPTILPSTSIGASHGVWRTLAWPNAIIVPFWLELTCSAEIRTKNL